MATNEQDRMARLLEQREQRYRSLFDYNLDAVFNLDQQVQLSEVNPAAVRLTGYSREQLLGMPILQLVVPEQRARAEAKYHEALCGRPADLEVTIAHKDGRQIDVYVTGGPIIVNGQTVGVFGIARDITQAKRNQAEIQRLNELLEQRVAERTASLNAVNQQLQAQIAERQHVEDELRQSESKYRGIVENTHDVIMLTRSDGIITYMSPATREVLGYEPEELVGRQPWIIHPDDLDRIKQKHYEALQGHSGTHVEYRILTRNGQTKWVSHSWSIIPDSPFQTIVSVVRDITERKKAQAQIERHQAQLQALASELILAEERERRRLAIDLHDDLGQKIAVARIHLTMLKHAAAGTDLEAPIAQLLQVIDEAMASSRSLTFQICPPALYDLGLLPAAEWLAEDMQQRYGLRVQLVDDGQPKPMDERVRVVLFRCLRELLINVAKHAAVNEATVTIRCQEDTIQLTVADKGSGFDVAQAAIGTNRRGFGLFSIQERLGYLGGAVQIRSAPGEGTAVTLQVPARLADPSKPEESP